MARLARRTRNLGRAIQKSVQGSDQFLASFEDLEREAASLEITDPLLEQSISSTIGETARSSAGATGTQAQQFASRTLAGATAGRGLLSRDSAELRRRMAAFEARRGLVGQLGSVVQGAFQGGPAAALVSADAQLKAARIAAEAQREASRFDLAGALGGGLLGIGAIIAEEDDSNA